MNGYPLLLDLTDRPVVVVGGGPVAARRTGALLDAGAEVTVVAPELCEDLADRVDQVRWVPREYRSGDLADAWLVQAATHSAEVNARIADEAERLRVWCVRADSAARSAAWLPAVTRTDDVTVAVTAGGDPGRAQRIRSAIAPLLDTAQLPVRRRRRDRGGRVALLGGGPGDPGLITTRARRLLADADVVVVDRLAPRALLEELAPEVEVIEAGKGPQAHHLTQLEINDLLVQRARAGQLVVRLKGGDPFVLGRGGEEVLACARAGIPYEVVPGVTSATAVPAAAGIPVTHRGIAKQFTVISAHTVPDGDTADWAALARLEGTLVILMGVQPLAEIAGALVAAGRTGETPVAVIERGTLPAQRRIVGTLSTIPDLVTNAGVRSPAVIVVGAVVEVIPEELAQMAVTPCPP